MKNLMTNLAVVATASAALSFAISDAASAASIPLRSPQVSIGASTDNGGTGPTLQTILNDRSAGINAATQQSAANVFMQNGNNNAIATLIIEIAGFKNTNKFGLYDTDDPTNPLQQLQIFAGGDSASTVRTVQFLGGGVVKVAETNQQISNVSGIFGFYLNTEQGNTFYTQDFLNPGKKPQALVYEGTGNGLDLDLNGSKETSFKMGSDWLIAWEDKSDNNPAGVHSDEDFNDMVVLVKDVKAVPEPLTMLGVGTAVGFGGYFKRELSKKQKKDKSKA